MEFEGTEVNSESGFGGKTFPLTAVSFEVTKLVNVPEGRMGEGNEVGFFWGGR